MLAGAPRMGLPSLLPECLPGAPWSKDPGLLCPLLLAALAHIRVPCAVFVLPPSWTLGGDRVPAPPSPPSLCVALWPQTPSWAPGPPPSPLARGHHARPHPTSPSSPWPQPAQHHRTFTAAGSGLPPCRPAPKAAIRKGHRQGDPRPHREGTL